MKYVQYFYLFLLSILMLCFFACMTSHAKQIVKIDLSKRPKIVKSIVFNEPLIIKSTKQGVK